MQLIVIKLASNSITNEQLLRDEMDVVTYILKDLTQLQLKYSLSRVLQNNKIRLAKIAAQPQAQLVMTFPEAVTRRPAPLSTQAATDTPAASGSEEEESDGLALGAGVAIIILLLVACCMAVVLGRSGQCGYRIEEMLMFDGGGSSTLESVELRTISPLYVLLSDAYVRPATPCC